MTESVRLIVEAFVSVKDKVALEEMRQHRQKLKSELQEKQKSAGSTFNLDYVMNLVDEDLAAIEGGFERL